MSDRVPPAGASPSARRRAGFHPSRLCPPGVLALAVLLSVGVGEAAEPAPILLPERFEVRAGGESFLGIINPDFHRGPIAPSPRTTVTGIRLVGDISRSGFVAVLDDGTRRDAVAYRYRTELALDLRLPSGLVVGAGLPFVQQRGRLDPDVPRLDGDALGDGWLEAVHGWRVFGDGHIGLAARVTVPIGNEDLLLGIGTPALLVEAVGGWQVHPRVLVASNVGVRTVAVFGRSSRSAGDEFVYRLGGTVEIAPPLRADLALDGAVAIEGEHIDSRIHPSAIAPLEGRLGLRWNLFSSAAAIHAGAGFGLTRGQGTPLSRFILGVELACALGDCPLSGGADRDGDGVPDRDDRCPERAGPDAGCPASDRDGDGIEDGVDECPIEPEDGDGFADGDGCPDPDDDGDGIPDTAEEPECRLLPEDHDGVEDEDGCPDPDDDGDGVPDIVDRCPRAGAPAFRALVATLSGPLERSRNPRRLGILRRLENSAEDPDGFEDADGCPDLDHDRDGIADGIDRCPRRAGDEAQEGCPLRAPDDADDDGISDDLDACPSRAESFDDIFDGDGCPEQFVTPAMDASLTVDDEGRLTLAGPLGDPEGRTAGVEAVAALLDARRDLRLLLTASGTMPAGSRPDARLVEALRRRLGDGRLIGRCDGGGSPAELRLRVCAVEVLDPARAREAGWPLGLARCDDDDAMEGRSCPVR